MIRMLLYTSRWQQHLWWAIRGVAIPSDFRKVCERCGRTGQAHWSFDHCWRFKRKDA